MFIRRECALFLSVLLCLSCCFHPALAVVAPTDSTDPYAICDHAYNTLLGNNADSADEALETLLAYAEDDYVPAQCMLGTLYDFGIGVPQNAQEATRWFTLAADSGNAMALYQLGGMYAREQSSLRDYDAAFQLFLRSANWVMRLPNMIWAICTATVTEPNHP